MTWQLNNSTFLDERLQVWLPRLIMCVNCQWRNERQCCLSSQGIGVGWRWGGQRELSSTAKPELDTVVRFVSPQAGGKTCLLSCALFQKYLARPTARGV